MIKKDTHFTEGILIRLEREMFLNVDKPSAKIRKQYSSVRKDMIDLLTTIDILNETIDVHREAK